MRRSTLVSLGTLALVASLALAACKRQEAPPPAAPPPAVQAPSPQAAPAPAPKPFRVTAVTIGNAVGPDKRVTTPTSTLAATDTIYASVASEGETQGVELTARWLYEDGQLVKEESLTLNPGTTVAEFHIAKPDGWPTGRYKVEIHKDGAAAAAQEFEVR